MLHTHVATFSIADESTALMSVSSGTGFFNGLPISSNSTSLDGLPYADFHSGQIHGSDHMINGAHSQPIWSYQYGMNQTMTPATMAPALLGGGYVDVNTEDVDIDMDSYDDADVALPPSPQEVIPRQDGHGISEDERRVRRSIYVSSTGGKTVKRDQGQPGSKSEVKKSKREPDFHNRGVGVILHNLHDIERIPGSSRLRKKGGSTGIPKLLCRVPMPDGKPCTKAFKRLKHLNRHEKTHSGQKNYDC